MSYANAIVNRYRIDFLHKNLLQMASKIRKQVTESELHNLLPALQLKINNPGFAVPARGLLLFPCWVSDKLIDQ